MSRPRYLPAGETALVVEFGQTADRASHDQVLSLDAAVTAAAIDGVREIVPTYRSLMIHVDPRVLAPDDLIDRLDRLERQATSTPSARHWRIPACYDEPCGEDLDELSNLLRLSSEEIVGLHVGARYRVVMYGFAPGFVFLDGLPSALKVSRRQTPRAAAPPGSLTIANGQALIASIAMPTGWYVLGRTPARTFDLARTPVFPIAVGDSVSFERIDPDRFEALRRDAEGGTDILRADILRAGG